MARLRRKVATRADVVGALRRRASMSADRVFATAAKRVRPPRLPSEGLTDGIALVTVNFSTTRCLKLMLATLADSGDLDLVDHLVIVDNASKDLPDALLTALERECPKVTVVRLREPTVALAG